MSQSEIKSKIPIFNWQARTKAPPNEDNHTLKKVATVTASKPTQRNLNHKAILINAKSVSASAQIKEQTKPRNRTLKPNAAAQQSNVLQQKNVLSKTKDVAKAQTKANAVKSSNPVATKTTRTAVVDRKNQNNNKVKPMAGVVKLNNKVARTAVGNVRTHMNSKDSVSSTAKNNRMNQVNGNKNQLSTRTQLGGGNIAQDADNADICMNWGSEISCDDDFGKENHASQANIEFEADELYRKMILSDRPLSPSIMKLENGVKVSFFGKTSFSTGDTFKDAMKAIENLRPSGSKLSGVIRRESALQILQKERDSKSRPHLPFDDESFKKPLKALSALEKRPKTVKKVTFKFSPTDENCKSQLEFNQKNILQQEVPQHDLLTKVSNLSLKIGENSTSSKNLSCKLDGLSNLLRGDRQTLTMPSNVSNQLAFGNPRTLLNQNHGSQMSSIKNNQNRFQDNMCKTFSNQHNVPNSEFAASDHYKKMVLSGKTLSPMGGKFSWGGERAAPFDRRSSRTFQEAMLAIRRSTTTGAYIRATNVMTSTKSAASNTKLSNLDDQINHSNKDDDNTPVLERLSTMPLVPEENSSPLFKLKISEAPRTNSCLNTKSDCSPFSQNPFLSISKPANSRTYSKKLCTPRPISFNAKSEIAADSYTPEYLDRRASNLLPFAPINTPLVLKGLAKSPNDSYDGVAQKLNFENSPKVESVVVNLRDQFSKDNDLDLIPTKIQKPVVKDTVEAKEFVSKVHLKNIPTRDKMLEFLADEECRKFLCNAAFPSLLTRKAPKNPIQHILMTGNETHFVPISP